MDTLQEIDWNTEKKLKLEILSAIHEFCTSHDLKYFLAYGSLLGAVRHKGFIPWDDDIDLIMPRSDYNKFISTFSNKRVSILSPENNKKTPYSFTKVFDSRTIKYEKGIKDSYCGVDVDVFPIDGCPSDKKERERFFRKQLKDFQRFRWTVNDCSSKKKYKWIAKEIIKSYYTIIYGKHRLALRLNKRPQNYFLGDSKYSAMSVASYIGEIQLLKTEWFEDIVKFKFEGFEFNAPQRWDECLSAFYGDYMKLPPEEKRITHHDYNVYIKKNEEI